MAQEGIEKLLNITLTDRSYYILNYPVDTCTYFTYNTCSKIMQCQQLVNFLNSLNMYISVGLTDKGLNIHKSPCSSPNFLYMHMRYR